MRAPMGWIPSNPNEGPAVARSTGAPIATRTKRKAPLGDEDDDDVFMAEDNGEDMDYEEEEATGGEAAFDDRSDVDGEEVETVRPAKRARRARTSQSKSSANPTRGTHLSDLSPAFKSQIRACILVHGPFAGIKVIREFYYPDYCEILAAEGPLVSLELYTKFVSTTAGCIRNRSIIIVNQIMSGSEVGLPQPALPDFASTDELAGLKFNLAWMLAPAKNGPAGSFDISPFFMLAAQRMLRWNARAGAQCIVAVSDYLNRLNARVAKASPAHGPPPKRVVLDQIAPLLVLTTACYAIYAIGIRLGLNRETIPPLHFLYAELLKALNKQDGPLGYRFVKQCRALVQGLCTEAMGDRAPNGDVRRDTRSGVPLVAMFDSDDDDDDDEEE
ncbi:hypothetical protein H9P43_006254 [Blastocladiella emersonii ATCC 22665]|nr:hypothetical protein H9P43_006254 [Blastocladiella emersonii ATCC 22665]